MAKSVKDITVEGMLEILQSMVKPTNSVIDGKGFYISYNPNPPASDEGPETALVYPVDGTDIFAILLGDWREKYSEHLDSLDECLAIFNENKDKPEYKASWSEI